MKDALGHGSNGLTEALRTRFPESTILKSSSQAALSNGPSVPIHPAMGGSYVSPPPQGGQALVRSARGGGRNWADAPIQNLKGIHR